jgi:hypothetical protein
VALSYQTLEARYECKAADPDSDTTWIVIEHDQGTSPRVIRDLLAAGWTADPRRQPPAAAGVARTTLLRRGSKPMGRWSAAEREIFLAEADEILARHGFGDVPLYELDWREFV